VIFSFLEKRDEIGEVIEIVDEFFLETFYWNGNFNETRDNLI